MYTEDEYGIAPVDSVVKALELRKVYGKINGGSLTVLQQIRWFFKYLKSNNRAYVAINASGEPIGYGLVTDHDGEWNVAGAMVPDYNMAGRTFLRFLTNDALLSSGQDVFSSVPASDIGSIKLHMAIGYKVISLGGDGILKMKWSGKLVEA